MPFVIVLLFVAFQLKSQQPVPTRYFGNPLTAPQVFPYSMALVSGPTSDSVFTKRGCATPVLHETYEKWVQETIAKQNQFASIHKINTVYTIPVVFHIIHNGEALGTGRNISQALINDQLNILNTDYRKANSDFSTWVTQTSFINAAADCEINFCAAVVDTLGAVMPEPGIDRINRNTKGWSGPSYRGVPEPGGYIDNTIKATSYWQPAKYLNIWVLEMSDGVLGYAQYPDVPSGLSPIGDLTGLSGPTYSDGVVLDYRTIASNGNAYPSNYIKYNKGRTAVHEIGHWLGLRHINGDATCGNDYVSDTPTQSSFSSSCPTIGGAPVASGCIASPTPPGKMYQNYMDYSDDKCAVMFTSGQKARMQACLSNCPNRTSLNTSTVCSVPFSVKENELNSMFYLYPNPTQGEVFLDFISTANHQDVKVVVTNALGQLVKESQKILPNTGTYQLNLSDQPKGVYVVTVTSGIMCKTKRIVLQ